MWLPAVFFAATLMSHLVVGVFAVYAAIVIWLIRGPLRTATRAAAIVVVGGLLTAVWTLPLAVTLKYTTDMRYEPVNLTVLASGGTTSYFDWLFISEHWFLFPLMIVAIIGGIVYRRRSTLDVVAIGVAAGVAFYCWEGLRDVFGKAPAWNLRLLPFWYVMLYLGAALGAAEIVRLASRFCAWVAYGTEDLTRDPDGWSFRSPRRRARSSTVRPTARRRARDRAPEDRRPAPPPPSSCTGRRLRCRTRAVGLATASTPATRCRRDRPIRGSSRSGLVRPVDRGVGRDPHVDRARSASTTRRAT